MGISIELDKYLKENIEGCVEVYDIETPDLSYNYVINPGDSVVRYVKGEFQNRKSPIRFTTEKKHINLKSINRDFKLTELLKSKSSDFDVESIIYTDEQRSRLNQLRKNKAETDSYSIIKKLDYDYSHSFNIGQKIWYNNTPGIITFKHFTKKGKTYSYKERKNIIVDSLARYTVIIDKVEYRYVSGSFLRERFLENLVPYGTPIDPKLNKLSTEKLLKKYRIGMKFNYGKGDAKIKAILNQREHIE